MATQGLLWFHMDFAVVWFLISAETKVWILIGIALNLKIAFGRMVIFIGLILLILEHRMLKIFCTKIVSKVNLSFLAHLFWSVLLST